MIYNSKFEADRIKAKDRLEWIFKTEKRFELLVKRDRRTEKQNRYLHLLLSYFAIEYGETLDYIKLEIFKKIVNPDVFKSEHVNKKTGEVREDWLSTAKTDTKVLSTCIDRFRNWSLKEADIYLPTPNEKEFLDHIQNEIELQGQWL